MLEKARFSKSLLIAGTAVTLVLAGCNGNKSNSGTNSNGAYKSAINSYYTAHPVCLWSSPVKFPTEADPKNEDQSKGYDALTDAGMLTRTAAQKKRFLVGSKEISEYDLSAQGRSQWQADQNQPGYGNFCYGHRDVTSIDGASESTANGVTQETVNYHYDLTGVPDWAKSAEMKAAFPNLAQNESGQQTATATLVQTQNGWQVSNAGTDNTGATPNANQQ
jgi:hypothetical protein